MLIAVAPHKLHRGVASPSDPRGGSDWRITRGTPGNERGVVDVYQVGHVDTMFRERYRTDAHFVAYVMTLNGAPLVTQPRVTKDGLDWTSVQGYRLGVTGLVADVDRPGHVAWETTGQAAQSVEEAKRVAPRAIVYATSAGLRIVQPLTRSIDVEDAESAIAVWLGQLEMAGLVPDRACMDWTRHYRMPHVAREGSGYRDALAMRLDYEPVEPPARGARTVKRGSLRASERDTAAIAWSSELPPHLGALAVRIADALETVPTNWHDTHLAIAGALAKGGVDPGHLPRMAETIAALTRDAKPGDRRTAAETTARRYAAGQEVRGMRYLLEHAAAVAEVIEQATGRREPEGRRAPPPAPTTLAEVARVQIVEAIRRANERLTVVQVPCGTGKTAAIRAVAIERAARAIVDEAKRAPLGTRTCVSVPTHDLGAQIVADIERQVASDTALRGVTVARIIGIASHQTDGKPTCRYVGQAMALAAGGVSTHRELCDGRGRRCQEYETCSARDGIIGPVDARIVVGPHALVHELDAMAGKTGLLCIDEPPEMLRTVRIRREDITHALVTLGRIAPRYGSGMRPALLAVDAWLGSSELVEPGLIARAWERGVDPEALEEAFAALGATSIEEAAAMAIEPREDGAPSTGTEPVPLTGEAAFDARLSIDVARAVGRAARTMRDLREAVMRPDAHVAQVEAARDGSPAALVLTLPAEGLRRAVRRQGPVIVLAADADLHTDMVARAIGYEPELVRVEVAEGAPVRRVLIEARATRTAWLRDGGRTVALEAARSALRSAVAEVGAARRVLVVTFRLVAEALRRDPQATQILQSMGGELAYYGGLRGLDRWADADACITLGDPRPNLGDVEREVRILRGRALEHDVRGRLADLAAAELEQAHGRLRLVHRRRPATCVHVGDVMPRGWYAPVEVRSASRPPETGGLREAVAEAGGTSEAARLLGVQPAAVRRWLSGMRAPPDDVLPRLRAASGRVMTAAE